MALQNIRLDRDKIKRICCHRGLSLRQLAGKLDTEKDASMAWASFAPYYYGKNKMPPDLVEKLAEVLDVDMEMVIDEESYDLKASALSKLKQMGVEVDLGYEKLSTWFRCFTAIAPYFLTQPRDEVQKDIADKDRESLRAMLTDITNAGEKSDD